jgi:hypothetical protein
MSNAPSGEACFLSARLGRIRHRRSAVNALGYPIPAPVGKVATSKLDRCTEAIWEVSNSRRCGQKLNSQSLFAVKERIASFTGSPSETCKVAVGPGFYVVEVEYYTALEAHYIGEGSTTIAAAARRSSFPLRPGKPRGKAGRGL